jgi:hypothetical protein
MALIASSMKERIIHLILIALFGGFLAILVVALFWHQPKVYSLKQAASILLFFFR